MPVPAPAVPLRASRWLAAWTLAAATLFAIPAGALLARTALSEPVVSEPREVERLLREGSSALVAVSIESNRMRTEVFDRHEITPTRRLTFHVPASTVFRARTREGTGGGQLLGFRLWSRTLDPVRPDEVADPEARYCELQGYLGQWPLFMWVLSNRAAEWDETFLRVRDHLAKHVVSRSDR